MEVSPSELVNELRILERLSSLIEARRRTVIDELEVTTAGARSESLAHGPSASWPRSGSGSR